MKVTPYTEGSPQLSSVVGDQTTECIQIYKVVVVCVFQFIHSHHHHPRLGDTSNSWTHETQHRMSSH